MCRHVYHKRTYTLQNTSPHFIRPPLHIKCESDLHTLFQPLITLIDLMTNQRKEDDDRAPIRMNAVSSSDNTLAGQITQTGSKIKVHWSKEEIGDTGWKSGWYVATVHKYCEETDMLTINYVSEPNQTYNEELLPLLSNSKIKLLWSPL